MKNPYRGVRSSDSIAIVVLGDLDRSPRMVNHALEAASYFDTVDLIGYRGSSL